MIRRRWMSIPFYSRKREIQKEYEIMSMKYAFLKEKLLLFEREIRKTSQKRNSYFEFIFSLLTLHCDNCIIIKSYQLHTHTENLKWV